MYENLDTGTVNVQFSTFAKTCQHEIAQYMNKQITNNDHDTISVAVLATGIT